jgi:pyrimidine oxygenase
VKRIPRGELPAHTIGISCFGVGRQRQSGRSKNADAEKLKAIGAQLRAHSTELKRKVGTYAQFVVIAAESDTAARRQAEEIIAGADLGAIRNVLASASLDTNPGGTSEALRTGMERPVELGNLVFMGRR